MKLELSSGQSRDNPTEADIAAAIRDDDNEFVFLEGEGGCHLYASRQRGGTFYVERCDEEDAFGMPRRRRAAELQPAEKLIELLTMYNRGDESYRTAVEWDDVTREMGRGCAGVLILVAAGTALAAGVAAWLA